MYLEHVNITVADLDRSIDFYRRLLGFEVRWRRAADGELPAAAHVGDARHYIAMFEAPAASEPNHADYDAVGLNHFGFVVDDLDASRARLEELGIEPHLDADYEPGRRIYLFDPDGIEVELVEYERAAKASSA